MKIYCVHYAQAMRVHLLTWDEATKFAASLTGQVVIVPTELTTAKQAEEINAHIIDMERERHEYKFR